MCSSLSRLAGHGLGVLQQKGSGDSQKGELHVRRPQVPRCRWYPESLRGSKWQVPGTWVSSHRDQARTQLSGVSEQLIIGYQRLEYQFTLCFVSTRMKLTSDKWTSIEITHQFESPPLWALRRLPHWGLLGFRTSFHCWQPCQDLQPGGYLGECWKTGSRFCLCFVFNFFLTAFDSAEK